MKTRLYKFLAFASIVLAAFSCAKEQASDPSKPDPETPTYSTKVTVTLNLPEELTAAGFAFQANDVITWVYSDESIDAKQIKLSKKQISGATATFTMDVTGLDKADVEGFFTYNQSSSDNSNFSFVDGGTSLFLQTTPTAVNRKYVHLHTGMAYHKFVAGKEEASVDMQIAGSIFNVKPYTTDYNEENVVLVEIKSETNFLGTVQYNHASGAYKVQSTSKVVKLWSDGTDTSIEGAFPLADAKTEDTALNYYIAIPATKEGSPIPEYTITVQTDRRYYEYVYTTPLTVEDNKVVDIPLLLDKEHRSADPKPWYTCDEIGDYWIPGSSYVGQLYVDETNKTEGSGSIALDDFDPNTNVCLFYSVIPEGYDTECTETGLHLCFDFYCSDASKIVKNPQKADAQIELTSKDTAPRWDDYEVHWLFNTIPLQDGWNSVDLYIGDATWDTVTGKFDPSHLTLLRIYIQETTGPMDVKIDNIHFYNQERTDPEVFPGIKTTAYFHSCDNDSFFDVNHSSGSSILTTGQKEGTGYFSRTVSGDAEIVSIPRGSAPIDAKISDKTKGHLIFWFYVEDAATLKNNCTGGRIEISHSGAPAKQTLEWDAKTCLADKVVDGWNIIDLPFSQGSEVTPDDVYNPAGSNFFRIWFNGSCVNIENTYGIDAIAFYSE